MKRIIGIVLTLVFIMSVTVFPPVIATDNPTISITASELNINNEFDAAISISGNPGIAYFSLRLHFDKTKLVPISITKGTALPVGSITSSINVVDIDYVTAVWNDAAGTAENGVLYTVKFRVKEGSSGKTELSLTAHGVFDNSDDMNPVTATVGGTEVLIGPPAETLPTISLSSSQQDTNGEFNAIITAANNSGIAYFSLRLHFDKTKLEPVSITKGAAISVGSITSNVNTANIDYVTAVWNDADGMNENGVLYMVKFRVKDGVSGKTELNLTAHGIFDQSDEMNPVNFVLVGMDVDFEVPSAEILSVTTNGIDSITVDLNRPQQDDATLIVAVYCDKQLLYMKTQAITQSGENLVDSITMPAGADTIKAMMWKDMSAIQPLCEAKALKKSGGTWLPK